MNRVLEGVRVVELSTYAAAPGAGRTLADLGADVVKIEALTGDPNRKFGRLVNAPYSDDENPCFLLSNSNKRGIALDLKSAQGKEILYDLLKDADIFFTNVRIESLRRLNLAYEELHSRFPHLVYGHLSGYGLKGKDSHLPGYDITAFWARGGGLADFAFKGEGPIAVPYAVGDHSASMALVAGLLAALHKKSKTGMGEQVLISLLGIAVWINALMLTPAQKAYGDPWPKDKYLPMTPISNTYKCKDGEFVTLCVLDYVRDWGKFCQVIDREDLVDVERFNNPISAKQSENSKELVILLSNIFLQQDREYWLSRLEQYDVPHGKTQHMHELIEDEQAWANGHISRVTYASGNTTYMPNTPVQIGENAGVPCGPAPLLGEHTKEVLGEIGYSEEKIQSLLEAKVIACRS
jgi:crotonobetainyl-CoA:carnitine CoA-transferase CaiB-like acyl-CoA transferase